MRSGRLGLLLAGFMVASGSCVANAQLRVVQWNVTSFGDATTTARIPAFQTSIYGTIPTPLVWAGRRMAPDVIVAQEFTNSTSVTTFRNMLNTAPGSPGDWLSAPYISGPDTVGAFFYRSSKVTLTASLAIPAVTYVAPATAPPRNTERFDIRLVGYNDVEGAKMTIYGSHMKAGSATSDINQRLGEAQRIVTNVATLPAGRLFLLGGDFNSQNSGQAFFVPLWGSNASAQTGPFFDPIRSPGTWENNAAFRFIHTQDQRLQMDSRHDWILISAGLRDGVGMDYIGNTNSTYSTTTWNDPNHSYRAWGNDGVNGTSPSFINGTLNVTSNSFVGNVIAQALRDSCNNGSTAGGHLPIVADFLAPPKIQTSGNINLGDVTQGSSVSHTVSIENVGNTTLWGITGIANLRYTLGVSGNGTLVGSTGPFFEPAAAGNLTHQLNVDTSTLGSKTITLTISSSAPESPSTLVTVTANVIPSGPTQCGPADVGSQGGALAFDGQLDNNDFAAFITAFFVDSPIADVGGQGGTIGADGVLDNNDFAAFITLFFAGCP